MLKTAFKNLNNDELFVRDNLIYATLMGSHAYNLNGPDSDIDIYGCSMPPLEMIFPNLAGEIDSFGPKKPRFSQWRLDNIDYNGTELDVTIFGLPRYFQLLMENNPNIIDSLFVPEDKILFQNSLGKKLRDNRQLFLHKGLVAKFLGYASSQLDKIKNRQPEGKRLSLVQKYGYDIKHGYHLMRLLLECYMLLDCWEIEMESIGEILMPIRKGGWTLDQLLDSANVYKESIKNIEDDSGLPEEPRYDEIKNLLIDMIEEYYQLKNVEN